MIDADKFSALPAAQKAAIRQVLLNTTSLPTSIARQNSIAVAKISRIDFPNEWPSLFEELLHNITKAQNDETLLLSNLWTLHQVIKVMCSQRIARARENFQNVGLRTKISIIYSDLSYRLLRVYWSLFVPRTKAIRIGGYLVLLAQWRISSCPI